MPNFIFTDPDGKKYYASGDTPEAAFSTASEISPQEIAGLQRERSAASPYGRMQSEIDRGADVVAEQERFRTDPDVYRQIGEMAIPGAATARHLKSGEYGEAAESAALSAVPFARQLPRPLVKGALAAGGAALGMSGGATAGEEFGFVEDPSLRSDDIAHYKTIKGYEPDGSYSRAATERERQKYVSKRREEETEKTEKKQDRAREDAKQADAVQSFNKRNAATIKGLSDAQRAQLDAREVPGDVYATLKAKNDYLDGIAAIKAFEDKNADMYASLSKEEKGQFDSISNPRDPLAEVQSKSQLLDSINKERKKFTQTFTERHPEEMEEIQRYSYLASGVVPIGVLAHRALATRNAAKKAEEAYLSATSGKKTKTKEDLLSLRANQLEDVKELSPWVYGATAAASPLIPVAAAEAPNLIDMAYLPRESPAYKKAREAALPWANPDVPLLESPAADIMGRALMEGTEATGAGFALGEPAARFLGGTRGASGTLKSIREREGRLASEAEEKSRQAEQRSNKKFVDKLRQDYEDKLRDQERAQRELDAALKKAKQPRARKPRNPLVSDETLGNSPPADDILSK